MRINGGGDQRDGGHDHVQGEKRGNAVGEHLHEVNKWRSLFATHYHELTALQAKLKGLSCHAMKVKEWQGDVVFSHAPANPGVSASGSRKASEAEQAVKAILPDKMTPREVLDFLYRLKAMDIGE